MTQRIQSMLSYLPAEDRSDWLTAAMAIKSEEGEAGFQVWDDWSRTADNYDPAAARSVWRSCRGQGVTMGSLIHLARSNGWVDDNKHQRASPEQIAARKREQAARATREGKAREREMQQAARKAGWILHQAKPEQHAYLHAHGFPEAKGSVWRPDEETNLLCIPMRVGPNIVGVQMIDKLGSKKFLKGQRTSGAEYFISNEGRGCQDYWTEGYANALALRECLKSLSLRYRIHVCFSAGNLKSMANAGIIIADHDPNKVGEKSAIATGLPYWMPDAVGEDICDVWRRDGTLKTALKLRKWMASL